MVNLGLLLLRRSSIGFGEKQSKTMNTNSYSLKVAAAIAAFSLAILAVVPNPLNYLPVVSVAVSYVAVAGLLALIVGDYRGRRLRN